MIKWGKVKNDSENNRNRRQSKNVCKKKISRVGRMASTQGNRRTRILLFVSSETPQENKKTKDKWHLEEFVDG